MFDGRCRIRIVCVIEVEGSPSLTAPHHDPALGLITIVDNSGVTRVKTVPADKMSRAADSGVGLSDVFAVMAVDDGITASPGYDTPSGDMRLIPDLDAAVSLHDSRFVWAPAIMVDQ